MPSPFLALCVVLAAGGTVHYWPREAAFWTQDVWWESGIAREGMGMMIVTFALLAVAANMALTKRR